MLINDPTTLLHLLQLASPVLPVGAYSYSEGLEQLIDTDKVHDVISLKHWLEQELNNGAVRLEAAMMLRAYQAVSAQEPSTLRYWNRWLSAVKETAELRHQSWQMGRALIRLLEQIQPQALVNVGETPCNFAIAFGLAAAHWQIYPKAAVLSYLHTWAANLITAGVKLIPLGQTAGQKMLLELHPTLDAATAEILVLRDDQLSSCGWGLALASMAHEIQYTRLFRS
jgi:urease accessory protein